MSNQSFTLNLTKRQLFLVRDAVMDQYMLTDRESVSNELADIVTKIVDMVRVNRAKRGSEADKQAV